MHIEAPALTSAISLIAAVVLTAMIALAARSSCSPPEVSGQVHGGTMRAVRGAHGGTMLATILLLGSALRLLVRLNYPVDLVSDHNTYRGLAHRLVTEGRYGAEEGRAFWPPGLPFLLVFGSGGLSAFNIAGYLALVAGIRGLARQLFDRRMALMAAAIVTFWPNLIFLGSLATKEVVVAAAVPALVLCYPRAHTAEERLVPYAAGALAG
jgi:4-amino-4-deoxy-L-arabinose transferase-like glycosyltransferase